MECLGRGKNHKSAGLRKTHNSKERARLHERMHGEYGSFPFPFILI